MGGSIKPVYCLLAYILQVSIFRTSHDLVQLPLMAQRACLNSVWLFRRTDTFRPNIPFLVGMTVLLKMQFTTRNKNVKISRQEETALPN